MRKPKRLSLSDEHHDHASGGGKPSSRASLPLQNDYYVAFFRCYTAAMETIFYRQAAMAEIPEPVVLPMIRRMGNRVSLVFSTAKNVSVAEDGKGIRAGDPDPKSDELFETMHSMLLELSYDKPGVRIGKIGKKDEGVYEIDIKDPREALQLLLDFLTAQNAISCDLQVGATYSAGATAPPPADEALKNHLLRYLPQQAFTSAAKALEAERIIAASGRTYPFSINYMEALLEKAESGLPKRSAALEQHLSAYRWH